MNTSAAVKQRPSKLGNYGARPGRESFTHIVDGLTAANSDLVHDRRQRFDRHPLPSGDALESVVADLRASLFPAYAGVHELSDTAIRSYIGERLSTALPRLREQVRCGLVLGCTHGAADCATCERKAVETTEHFAIRLPEVRRLLGRDVQAAYEGDPAATSPDEVVFCYPGIAAITHHRIAHELYQLGVPLIPRIIAEIAHRATGIDIHPGARIGGSFFIDHGTGVVIGETTVIGERVRIYQGVTLGARSFPTDAQGRPIKGIARHPIVEDDVTIYAGATILGRVTIGRGSSIGGNVWLTHGVPPGSSVTQARARDDLFSGGAGI